MNPAQTGRRSAEAAVATATLTLFHEWARAIGATPPGLDAPDALRRWAVADPARLAAYAGLTPTCSFRANLLRHTGPRPALIAGGRTWTRDALRRATDLPTPVAAALDAGAWDTLLALAAHHLLHADTRPDDHVSWSEDGLACGAWLVGATVVLPG